MRRRKIEIAEPKIKPRYSLVDPIDRIPMIEFDKDELIKVFSEEKESIDTYRTEWFDRKLEFLSQWDNYIDYYKGKSVFFDQEDIHIPLTHEKIQAWHARMYKAFFSMDPFFVMEALNMATLDEVKATKQLLWWYLKQEINYGQGFKPFVDELLWDVGSDGWGIGYRRWETIQRKFIDIQKINFDKAKDEIYQALGDMKSKKEPKAYEEIEKIKQIYSGVIVETIPQECVYFPDYIPTSGNMNHPKLIMVEQVFSKDQLLSYAESGYFDKDAVKNIIEKGRGGQDARKQQLRRERQRMQGIEEPIWKEKDEYPIFTCFYRDDFKRDGYPQEYIFSASLKAKEVARSTYLDRICRDGNRPVYKFDLLKRPRSAYSRGLVELLYPLNTEIDEFHNLRRVSGKIANIPWGFYRASSGLEKEAIQVKPGQFFPVDDPIADVRPMQFGNVTSWALQEEALDQNYADKLTSMPPMMQGQVPSNVGPLRSTSGVMALMNEAGAPLDVYMDRFRGPMGQLLSGILSDIHARMSDQVTVKVLGEKGQLLYGQNGEALVKSFGKDSFDGKYRFDLAINDAQYNPEKNKQDALTVFQFALSPSLVQMGLTTPENAYHLGKIVYEKFNIKDIDSVITAPQMSPKPLNLFLEYTMCINGKMPPIYINDDHKSKIEGLVALSQTEEYRVSKSQGTISQISDYIIDQAIRTHAEYQQIIDSLPKTPNQSGMEIPVTMGARSVSAPQTQQGEQNVGKSKQAARADSEPAMESGGGAGEPAL